MTKYILEGEWVPTEMGCRFSPDGGTYEKGIPFVSGYTEQKNCYYVRGPHGGEYILTVEAEYYHSILPRPEIDGLIGHGKSIATVYTLRNKKGHKIRKITAWEIELPPRPEK